MSRDSGVLLTNFACSYLSVTRGWIFRVLRKPDLPLCLQSFFSRAPLRLSTRATYETTLQWMEESDKDVSSAGSCSPWLLALSSDDRTIVFPREDSLPALLQPTPRVYADDFAVTASSFRTLMSLLLFVSLTELFLMGRRHLSGLWWNEQHQSGQVRRYHD